MTALILHNPETASITDEQFYQLCAANRDLRLERTAKGDLIIMPPTGGGTGNRNLKIAQQLANWTDRDGTGIGFDSSTCFKLPKGATFSPDASWIPLAKWEALSAEQQEKFPPLCPDFIIELRSASDSLKPLQEKMQEYMDNGCRLGWLINPQNRQVEVYRQGQEKQILDNPASLSGEEVLPGFILNLSLIC
ncbi:Uma2 family endonuclease [Roseofilum sp. BLCC_M154]|uniref:Uma2 family endonuclease n=1 Tax=Roseofilum acuticapitatum BLCC-M154 TaxID=3022444 RepID=A0ABT7AV20_9CYAN|nr:Uma2 family endonuclease [Roseofilum acuticapitatum]MDJ1170762.1 Uma2 family endonuclease [Roseofilum acuticapitatum BLCC-M154]